MHKGTGCVHLLILLWIPSQGHSNAMVRRLLTTFIDSGLRAPAVVEAVEKRRASGAAQRLRKRQQEEAVAARQAAAETAAAAAEVQRVAQLRQQEAEARVSRLRHCSLPLLCLLFPVLCTSNAISREDTFRHKP